MKLLLISLLLLTASAHAQERLAIYKVITENRLKQDIKLQEADHITVANVFLYTDSRGNGKLRKYNENDNTPFLKAVFTYDFFKSALNYSFRLFIAISKSKAIEFDSTTLASLPNCALYGTNCDLISKDSALSIAKNDSFVSKNISAELLREHKTDHFFWYLVDMPMAKALTGSERPRLVIDAHTGKIISRKRSWTKTQ